MFVSYFLLELCVRSPNLQAVHLFGAAAMCTKKHIAVCKCYIHGYHEKLFLCMLVEFCLFFPSCTSCQDIQVQHCVLSAIDMPVQPRPWLATWLVWSVMLLTGLMNTHSEPIHVESSHH